MIAADAWLLWCSVTNPPVKWFGWMWNWLKKGANERWWWWWWDGEAKIGTKSKTQVVRHRLSKPILWQLYSQIIILGKRTWKSTRGIFSISASFPPFSCGEKGEKNTQKGTVSHGTINLDWQDLFLYIYHVSAFANPFTHEFWKDRFLDHPGTATKRSYTIHVQ